MSERVFLVVVVAALASVGLGACSSSSSSSLPQGDASSAPEAAARVDAGDGSEAGPADGAARPPSDGGAVSDAGGAGTGDGADKRGERYCEILAATVNGSNVDIKVYSTEGLNDCPDAQWAAEDTTALAQQLGVTQVILNGPRYWMMDSLVGTLINTTQVTLGGIAMRQAGAISTTLGAVGGLQMTPYVVHQIMRSTVVTFSAGKPVFELVDPNGKIYDMQSYSLQKVTTQTQATLPNLGAMLAPPAGWTWRTRTLASDLVLTTPGGVGEVVQDDDDNTYQQSQQ